MVVVQSVVLWGVAGGTDFVESRVLVPELSTVWRGRVRQSGGVAEVKGGCWRSVGKEAAPGVVWSVQVS